jgi:hypothetical protein
MSEKKYSKHGSIVLEVPEKMLYDGKKLKKSLTEKRKAPTMTHGKKSIKLKANPKINKAVIKNSGEVVEKKVDMPKKKIVKKKVDMPKKKIVKKKVDMPKKIVKKKEPRITVDDLSTAMYHVSIHRQFKGLPSYSFKYTGRLTRKRIDDWLNDEKRCLHNFKDEIISYAKELSYKKKNPDYKTSHDIEDEKEIIDTIKKELLPTKIPKNMTLNMLIESSRKYARGMLNNESTRRMERAITTSKTVNDLLIQLYQAFGIVQLEEMI